MPVNKISGQSAIPAMLPFALGAGETMLLPPGQGLVGGFGAATYPQIGTGNPLTGQYLLQLGQYTNLQVFNQGAQMWETVNVSPYAQVSVSSDGFNYRIANSTGCPVGAVITTIQTSTSTKYTDGFYGYNQQGAATTIVGGVVTAGQTYLTVTPSAGGSLWNAIIGGAISGTMSVSGTVYNGNYGVNNTFGGSTGGVTASGGAAYTKPPLVVFSPPPNQGQQPYILPTATAALTTGAVSSITVLDQGAGLLGLPGVTIVPQPGDTTGGGAVVGWSSSNNSEAGSGGLLALWPAAYGAAETAVVTLTFSVSSGAGAGAAATVIMNFTVTGVTDTTAGVGYTGAYAVWQGGITVATPASPSAIRYTQVISNPIFPQLAVAATTGICTLPAANMFQGVNIQAVPTIALGTQLAAGTVTTVGVQTPTVGGISDVVKLATF
jgi:hypothetical protein